MLPCREHHVGPTVLASKCLSSHIDPLGQLRRPCTVRSPNRLAGSGELKLVPILTHKIGEHLTVVPYRLKEVHGHPTLVAVCPSDVCPISILFSGLHEDNIAGLDSNLVSALRFKRR